jgi:hypothetical protein
MTARKGERSERSQGFARVRLTPASQSVFLDSRPKRV